MQDERARLSARVAELERERDSAKEWLVIALATQRALQRRLDAANAALGDVLELHDRIFTREGPVVNDEDVRDYWTLRKIARAALAPSPAPEEPSE